MCDGDESFLTDCTHVSLHNCDHSEDAGVRCEGTYMWQNVTTLVIHKQTLHAVV